jgi:hypothetical protein
MSLLKLKYVLPAGVLVAAAVGIPIAMINQASGIPTGTPPSGSYYSYAAKFACGTFAGSSPPSNDGVIEGPVKPGDYETAINVHNAQSPNPIVGPISFVKKAVLLYQGSDPVQQNPATFEQPKPPGKLFSASLLPDYGMLIDCQDIRRGLLAGSTVAPTFIEGYVILEIATPSTGPQPPPEFLDVQALYTSHGYNCTEQFVHGVHLCAITVPSSIPREGFSEDVVTITPKLIPATIVP